MAIIREFEGEDHISLDNDYKTYVRVAWFRMGKPGAEKLQRAIDPEPVSKRKPHIQTLYDWIRKDFKPFAEQLDQQIQDEMNSRLILEKVEMLQRHTTIAQEMQEVSLEWIRSHANDLNAISAARLLTAGIEIERMSRGIPKAMEKLANMKDEDIMARIQDIISRSPTQIEQTESLPEIIDIDPDA